MQLIKYSTGFTVVKITTYTSAMNQVQPIQNKKCKNKCLELFPYHSYAPSYNIYGKSKTKNENMNQVILEINQGICQRR